MSLKYPNFESEDQEADWLYDHRDLIEAEFLIAGTEGRLFHNGRIGPEPDPPWEVAPEELKAAKDLLCDSGLWTEDRPQLETAKNPELIQRAG